MTTGQKFTVFTNKRLLIFTDLGANFLDYLRQSLSDSVKTRWNVDGVFDTALGLAGGVDSFTITGASLATDGIGNIFDPQQAYILAGIPFENASGITYYVGFQYAETPTALGINPKTGRPEFTTKQEAIGVQSNPTSVIDNGNGTATFIVDSVTESGVSHAGRTVRVFLKTPKAGTFALAVEDLPVVWDGTNNTITTSGAFGQTAISTTPSDYEVVLLGPQVSKADLSVQSGVCFVGTLVGAGAGGTPTADNSNQTILKTYSDASQIVFTPYSYLASVDIQAAIQELVDDLASNGGGVPSYPGSTRVGVDPTAWANAQDAIGLSGGLGNVSDGTYTATAKIQDVFSKLDTLLEARRGWTYTWGDNAARHGSAPGTTNLAALVDGTAAAGGTHWLERLNDAVNFPYNLPDSVPVGAPYVLGEESGISDVTLKANVERASSTYSVYGHWERVYLRGATTAVKWIVGGSSGSNFQLEDFGIKTAYMGIKGSPKYGQPFRLLNGIFKAPSPAETNAPQASALQFGTNGSGDDVFHGTIENVIFEGPTTTQTSLAPTAVIDFVNAIGAINNADDQPLVFRGCVFINTRTDIPILTNHSVGNFARKVVFEDCVFIGVTGETQPLVDWDGGNIEMHRCLIYCPEGQGVRILHSRFVLDDVTVITGSGGTTVADPQTVALYGTNSGMSVVRNLQVLLDTSAVRSTGTATKPLVQLNGYDGNGARTNWSWLKVDGLLVKYIGGTGCHRAETLLLDDGIDGTTAPNYAGIDVDFQGVKPEDNGTSQGLNALVSVRGSNGSAYVGPVVHGLSVRSLYNPATATSYTRSVVAVEQAIVYGLGLGVGGVNSGALDSALRVGDNASVRGGRMDVGSFYTNAKGLVWMSGTNSDVEIDSDAPSINSGLGHVYISGQYSDFKGKWTNLDFTNYPAIYLAASDCKIWGGRYTRGATGGQGTQVIYQYTGTRRALIVDNHIRWDGTTYDAVRLNGNDSIVDNLVTYRTAGAVAAVVDSGTGNITGNVITSTVA